MADRVVKVTLRAQVAEYEAGMRKAAQATRETGSEAEKLAQKKQAFDLIGKTALGMGAAIGAGLAVAVGKFAEFDEAMSAVQAATHESAESMALLKDAALDAGARTVFSATEAANAIEELSKAGVETTDILAGGLDGALDLAAAGGLGVADAAGIAATALKTFNLEGSDMSHVADLLAAGAGKAMGDVTDLSAALAQGGMVASTTGLTIEETTASLAAFAAQGLLGSDAGTSLKTMLLSLNPASEKAAKLMDQLNLSAYDSGGNFIGMAEYAGKLQTALGDMSAEQQNASLKTIFGNDAYRAAAVLLDEGEQGVRDWISAVDDQGYAAETAALRLDNLKGDWEAFTGAVDTALISMGEGADGPLRALVQRATEMVDSFNGLPAWAQQLTFSIGGVASAASLAAGAFFLGAPKVVEYKNALAELGPTAQRTGRVVGVAMKGLGIVAAAAVAVEGVKLLEGAFQSTEKSAVEMANAIKNTDPSEYLKGALAGTEVLGGSTKAATEGFLDLKGALDIVADTSDTRWAGPFAEAAGLLAGNAEYASQYRDALENLGEALASMSPEDSQAAMRQLRDEYDLSGTSILSLIEHSGAYKESLYAQLNEEEKAANRTNLLAAALGDTGEAAEGAATGAEAAESAIAEMNDAASNGADDLDALKDALDLVGAAAMDAGAAQDSAQGAINDMVEAAKAEGVALDGTSDSSLAFRDSIREVETSHRDAAEAMAANGATADEATAAYERGREALIDQIQGYFDSREAATEWAEENLGAAEAVEDKIGQIANAQNGLIQTIELTPKTIDFVTNDDGTIDQSKRSLLELANEIVSTPDGSFDVNNDDIPGLIGALSALGYNVETLPDGTVRITGNGIDVTSSALTALHNQVGDRWETITTTHRSIFQEVTMPPHTGTPMYDSARGNLFSAGAAQAFENGGMPVNGLPTGIYAGRPEAIYKFAEPETRWEAFISGKPGMEERNRRITEEAAARLGGTATFGDSDKAMAFADGGILGEDREMKRLDAKQARLRAVFLSKLDTFRKDPTDKDKLDAQKEAWSNWNDAYRAFQAQVDVMQREKDSLRDRQDDFYTAQRRGTLQEQGVSGGGLGLVDQLRRAAEETGGRTGKEMEKQALASEKAFLGLERQAEKAADAITAAEKRKQDAVRKAEGEKAKLVGRAEDEQSKKVKKAGEQRTKLIDAAEKRASALVATATDKRTKLIDAAEKRASALVATATDKRTKIVDAAEAKRTKLIDAAQSKAQAKLKTETERANAVTAAAVDKWGAAVDKATKKLDSLTAASDQMAGGIEKTIRSKLNLGVLATATQQTKTVTDATAKVVDGIAVSATSTREETIDVPVSAKSVKSGLQSQARSAKALADKVKRLGAKGFTAEFINEVMSLGIEQAEPMIDALLQMSPADVKDTNALYKTINSAASTAGKSVADRYYGDSIKAAEKQLKATEKVAEKEIAAAEKRAARIIANAKTWGERQVNAATKAGNKVVADAKKQGDRVVAQAKAQADRQIAAATKQGDKLVSNAKRQGDRQVAAATKQGDKLVSSAKREGDRQIAAAKKEGNRRIAASKKDADRQIAQAKAQQKAINAKLKAETDRIIKALSKGLKNPFDYEYTYGYKRATGGPVIGAGNGSSDSIPTWLSNGEHVVTASEVEAAGGHAAVERMRRAFVSGTAPKLKGGGSVAYVPSSAQIVQAARAEDADRTAAGMPSELVVIDADGALIGRMRVEADRKVSRYDATISRAMRAGRMR